MFTAAQAVEKSESAPLYVPFEFTAAQAVEKSVF